MQIIYKILAAGVMAAMSQPSGDDPNKLKPSSMLNGHDTLIEFPMARMIRDQAAWQELWVLHKGIAAVQTSSATITNADARPAPTIDFTRNQVLIVFGGPCPNVQAYDYVRTDVVDNRAVIRLTPEFFPDPKVNTIMLPYIMMVLPKVKVGIDVDLETVARDGTKGLNRIASYSAAKDAPVKNNG